MSQTFTLKLNDFEGPIELLLRLIEKRKLIIHDVVLADVVDEFLQHAQNLEDYSYSDTTHFLQVATTLVLIKSKSLLPGFLLSTEEERDIVDLEKRIKAYEAAQLVGQGLRNDFGKTVLYSGKGISKKPYFSPPEGITITDMSGALYDLLATIPPPKPKARQATMRQVIHIKDVMKSIIERLQSGMAISFRSFSNSTALAHNATEAKQQKVVAVVSFLALLELVRGGVVAVEQQAMFSDISLEQL